MRAQRRAFDFTLLFSVPFVAAFLTVPDAIMRALFARGAFSKADAAAAGATLAAYAIGLIPFVLIRSAVATFYARKDTATPVRAPAWAPPLSLLLHGAALAALSNLLEWDFPKHATYLWTLPMFHCNGWSFPWTISALAGTHVCLR